jgi:hypothetical protein
MSPAEKRNLRVDWYGLAFGWPLSNDVHGQPYFLASNENGRHVDVSAAGTFSFKPVAKENST